MKKTILLAIAALALSPAFASRADAQIFRRACYGARQTYSYRAYSASNTYCRRGYCATAPSYGYWAGGQCAGGSCVVTSPAPCEPTTTAPRQAAATFDQYYPAPCENVRTETPSPCETCGEYEPIKTPSGALVYQSCPTGNCPLKDGAGSAIKAVASFLDRANAIRARYGLRALAFDSNLEAGSQYQANFCATRGALIHGAGVAEILAQNSAGFDYALSQWLNSPAHRALLLSPNFRLAGAAVYRDGAGRVWCAMRFR